MSQIYKSLVFKYGSKFFLGYVDAKEEIFEFRDIKYNTTVKTAFDELRQNEFVVVLVENNEDRFKMYDLSTVVVTIPSLSEQENENVVIGEISPTLMIQLANEVLKNNKEQLVYH